MSVESLMVHDVTLVRAGSLTDRYGNTVKNWPAATRTATRGWLSQRSRSEELGDREAQVSDWILYLRHDETVTGLDRVEWENLVFEVDGPVNPAWNPQGLHHLELALRRVDG